MSKKRRSKILYIVGSLLLWLRESTARAQVTVFIYAYLRTGKTRTCPLPGHLTSITLT